MEGVTNKKSTGEGADLKLVELHRSKRPAMIKLAEEFASALHELCHKYNSQCKPYYAFSIGIADTKTGIEFNCVNAVYLLDLYYPEQGNAVIDLVENLSQSHHQNLVLQTGNEV